MTGSLFMAVLYCNHLVITVIVLSSPRKRKSSPYLLIYWLIYWLIVYFIVNC